MSLPTAFVFNHVGASEGSSKQMNLSTLAVVRSLGRRGIPVVLVTPSPRDWIADSRYVKQVQICPYMHESEQAVLDFLHKLAAQFSGVKVLIPTVDECAWYVGRYYQELAQYFLIPAPNGSTMEKVNNKRFQYETADALGIPIPETYFPQSMAEVEALAATIKHYPYVIKPNVSFEWKMQSAAQGARGKKGLRVDNADELLATAKKIFIPGQDFMIQEVIGGRDQRLVTFLGFFDEHSQPNSWFIRKKMRQCPIDFGYCTMTESCHDQQVYKQSVALLQAIKYQGIAGVEWKLDPETNTYKLIEINGRPVNTTGCAIASGVDLPAIAYFHKISQPLPPVTDWKDGQRWAWLAMDFWSARELISLGQGSMWQWFKEAVSIKADAVFAWDDLSLSLAYYGKAIASAIKRKFA